MSIAAGAAIESLGAAVIVPAITETAIGTAAATEGLVASAAESSLITPLSPVEFTYPTETTGTPLSQELLSSSANTELIEDIYFLSYTNQRPPLAVTIQKINNNMNMTIRYIVGYIFGITIFLIFIPLGLYELSMLDYLLSGEKLW